jgi:hypothetical protein
VIEPATPADESERLGALRALDILDTPPEQRFDRLTQAAAKALGTPIAVVSLVDADRQWFKSKVGLEAAETPRNVSFCGHALHGDQAFVVTDAHADARFHDNPLVTGEPGVRFYAGHPITTLDGHRVGTLCVIDRRPHAFSKGEREALRSLADAASDELSAHRVKLGTHRLLEVIGRGGMGVVYKAIDEALGRTVAVKIVLREHAADAEFVERFRREGRALAALSHPNVLGVYALDEAHGVPYMVCEYLPGGTLARALRDGPRPPAEVARLGAALASALATIGEAGIVHRDVKPANVLFDARGRPKLGDFGLVRQVSATASTDGSGDRPTARLDPKELRRKIEEAEARASDATVVTAATMISELTGHDGIVGTITYMAPEQARGTEVDARADLWGLGATLFHAATGVPPFGASPRVALSELLGKATPPRARDLVPAIPEALDRVLARLLSADPAARGTADEAAEAFEDARR